jgi:single-strand DNA-binding protein
MRDINSLNKVTLIGRLGQNPEVRYLPQTERAVARFSLATNERFLNPKTNQTDDRTEWHRIVVWGKLAEFCEKFLTQGKQIYLEGKLRTRSWQDKDGNKRFTTEVEARNIILLGKKGDVVEEQAYPESKPSPEAPEEDEASPVKDKEGEGEDDIPF